MVVPRAGALGPGRPPSCAQTDGSCLQPLWQALCEYDRSEATSPEGRTPALQKNNSPSVNFGLPKAKPVDVGSFYFAFKALFFSAKWFLEKYFYWRFKHHDSTSCQQNFLDVSRSLCLFIVNNT